MNTPNPVPELAPLLKQLRLSGILDSLDSRNRQAIDQKLAYTEFLALLIASAGEKSGIIGRIRNGPEKKAGVTPADRALHSAIHSAFVCAFMR